MIFAAGVGSRLKPWTDSHPKALVEVGGKPVLGRVIDRFLEIGIKSITVNVHHFASQVEEYIKREYRYIDITISDERKKLLDTGGGLVKAFPGVVDEAVLIHNADIVTDLDLTAFMKAHKNKLSDATLLVQKRDTSRYFLFKHNRLKGWTDTRDGRVRPEGLVIKDLKKLAFGGVHCLSPDTFDRLHKYGQRKGPVFSIIDFYIDTCDNLIFDGYELPPGDCWFDVGKPATLDEARAYFKKIKHE